MICLGIESTAHTFSVGIVNSKGETLGLSSDAYKPSSGGLKPVDVVEHHYNYFEEIIESAIEESKISFDDINLIAFSQGPGLGPCLRVGAAVARSLSLKLKIPLVGINHCIAHLEIGRQLCDIKDPLTLYVSGGNTIISAFESDRYQIFGETMDLPIGNMLDMIGREIGISHPGGPEIEKMAKKGNKYVNLPYIVKGMDLSYSGLFTSVKRLIKKAKSETLPYSIEDILFSLQETSFAMLTEVCERAIAHTGKNSVLLTGGVAANKRLQDMIKKICVEHKVDFQVVPMKYAGDNGAMIAWNGIIQCASGSSDEISKSSILPKWRMDDVPIPWRKSPFVQNQKPNKKTINKSNKKSINNEINYICFQNSIPVFNNPLKIYQRGAEAILLKSTWFNRDILVKHRISKSYRIPQIDKIIRLQRTKLESKILNYLSNMGIRVPPIYDVIPKEGLILMKYIKGKRVRNIIRYVSNPKIKDIFYRIGQIIGKIHNLGVIHGDLTTSNILYTENNELFFIDFGLAEWDYGVEERGMDLHLFRRVILSTHGSFYNIIYPEFIKGYSSILGDKSENIIARSESIELRGRYIKKNER